MRILKGHTRAVKTALESGPYSSQSELLEAVALAVLTAYDEKMRHVVVTSEGVAFGPYATSSAAYKVIEKGHCATRKGVKAMVLPMMNTPRGGDLIYTEAANSASEWEQLTLWGDSE